MVVRLVMVVIQVMVATVVMVAKVVMEVMVVIRLDGVLPYCPFSEDIYLSDEEKNGWLGSCIYLTLLRKQYRYLKLNFKALLIQDLFEGKF